MTTCQGAWNTVTLPLNWYLFSYLHLHIFELLGWQEARQGTGTHSIAQCLDLEPGLSVFQLTRSASLTTQPSVIYKYTF